MAACETAKFVLFYRSILHHQIGLKQTAAAINNEDNNKGALLLLAKAQHTY
jgi:hypothetical protein